MDSGAVRDRSECTPTSQSLCAADTTRFPAPGLLCTDRPLRLPRKPALRLPWPLGHEGDEEGGEISGPVLSASRGGNLQPINIGREDTRSRPPPLASAPGETVGAGCYL